MARGGKPDIDIVITGDEAGVIAMLDRLDSCFSPMGMAQFMSIDVAPWLRQRAKERFAGEGDSAVGKWAPLRPTTRYVRAHGRNSGEWPDIGPSHPINVRTHDMETYITQGRGDVISTPASTALIYPQRRTPVRKGLDKKVRQAQRGGYRGSPPRPVLGVGAMDMSYVLTALAFFIRRGPA